MWRVEVAYKSHIKDVVGASVKKEILEDIDINAKQIRVIDVYTINRQLDGQQIEKVAAGLLADPIIQDYSVNGDFAYSGPFDYLVEVGYRPGVTDNVAVSAIEGIEDLLGIEFGENDSVHTSKLYVIEGRLKQPELEKVISGYLVNEVVEEYVQARDHKILLDLLAKRAEKAEFASVEPTVNTINLDVDDNELVGISRQNLLSLELMEMGRIRDYYRSKKTIESRREAGLTDQPTDAELEMIAQTWSEHCKHKIFNGLIEFTQNKKTIKIDSLFKTYIKGATDKVAKKKKWLVSVFVDNAGVISFNDTHNLVFKVETHNHPSALDPYGGAITGIVGVNRDPMGTGIGAELIFNTDVFCFGPPDFDYSKLPDGVLHPKRIFRGVRRGVEHGGNKMGIPTVNGTVLFDEAYVYNPLVYCGTGGIMPKEICSQGSEKKQVLAGDMIVMVGGRVGKDGIHGATFSSAKLEEDIHASVVQIGAPIVQKKMMDALKEARDRCLYRAITDNGAGGLSSSVGEMAQYSGGAKVELDKVPVKYPGLVPWELWVSEAQERMTVAVNADRIDDFQRLMDSRDVEATVIGEFTDDGKIHVTYLGQPVIHLDLRFLHEGLVRTKRIAHAKEPEITEGRFSPPEELTGDLRSILGSLNVCSKEWLIRQYDHEVQGTSVIKPLVGKDSDGPSDAAVLKPLYDRPQGVAVSNGINPLYGMIDPYRMAVSAVDEAIRNIVAVGGDPEYIALLDNFCWGNPIWSGDNLDGDLKMGDLVRAAQGCYDAAIGFEAPFISGKDSFHNEYELAEKTISIPPTLLISAIGVIQDVAKTVTMDAKKPGDIVYIIGKTFKELGGSHYYKVRGFESAGVPGLHAKAAMKTYRSLHGAIVEGLVESCHDCSEGGIAVAAAETAFAGGLGMKLDLSKVVTDELVRDDYICFSESNSRFVVTVDPANADRFEKMMKGSHWGACGEVLEGDEFSIVGLLDNIIVNTSIFDLKEAWQAPLRW